MENVHALDSGRASNEEDEENERRSSRDREQLNVTRVPWQEGERQEEENLGILFETHGGLATTAVDALPTVNISEEHLNSDINPCAVCKEEFELGAETRQMPCEHLFHPDCILPWLTIRRSCPVCRSQLPSGSEDNDDTSGNNPSSYSSGSDNEPQITQHDSINNDNGASSSSAVAPRGILTSSGTWLYRRRQTTPYVNNNNDNRVSSSSSVAPRGTATTSWNHPHID